MHLTICIYHTLFGIVMHAGGAHVVVHGRLFKFPLFLGAGKLIIPQSCLGKLFCPNFLDSNGMVNIDRVNPPVDLSHGLPEAIAICTELDAIIRIGCLFNLIKDFKFRKSPLLVRQVRPIPPA